MDLCITADSREDSGQLCRLSRDGGQLRFVDISADYNHEECNV